jgi:CheY-like chemotaxis protein
MAIEPDLIVDGNPQNLKLAKVIFAIKGYEVLSCMDGLELVRRLKADAAQPARSGVYVFRDKVKPTRCHQAHSDQRVSVHR